MEYTTKNTIFRQTRKNAPRFFCWKLLVKHQDWGSRAAGFSKKTRGMLRENMLNNNIGDVNRFHLNFPGDWSVSKWIDHLWVRNIWIGGGAMQNPGLRFCTKCHAVSTFSPDVSPSFEVCPCHHLLQSQRSLPSGLALYSCWTSSTRSFRGGQGGPRELIMSRGLYIRGFHVLFSFGHFWKKVASDIFWPQLCQWKYTYNFLWNLDWNHSCIMAPI